ncbi:Ail/Lom family outer membrane beta-barrel protein [Proteus terrae]|uniref:Ail/Lom family outer membrane beta-barrel protein n=1 Tax=Proteus terrae TaxID=1574161 RepID=UPI0025AEDB57|nr:Ail/Lom family outer membrane beta-barrel protein [Proteus terrae]
MNKLVLILISFALSYSSTLHAYDKIHTLSAGYIYGKIKGDTAKGEIISYRYETENTWGILISLLRLNTNHKEYFIDPRFTTPSTIKYRTKTTGLLIGPTYRITPEISVYAQMGPNKLKYQEDKHHSKINTIDSHIVNTTSVIGQIGIDYNPIRDISFSLGYLYSDTTANKRHFELSVLQLSLGFRF